MTYHVGDEREMELCVKEYKGKLGPKLYREAMFKVRWIASLLRLGAVWYCSMLLSFEFGEVGISDWVQVHMWLVKSMLMAFPSPGLLGVSLICACFLYAHLVVMCAT